eukprot:616159-Pyramimonas_sp.AAC.1
MGMMTRAHEGDEPSFAEQDARCCSKQTATRRGADAVREQEKAALLEAENHDLWMSPKQKRCF